MRGFQSFPGEPQVVEYLRETLSQGVLSQSYIFEGCKGTGRNDMAYLVAAALLCTERGEGSEPCGKCRDCMLMESGNHPDCIIVSHEKAATLTVSDIRNQVVDDMAVRPYYGRHKVYIIPDAELMNANAQNALLKSIEEPPEYALIILIVNNREQLLPTIRSRCMTLSFRQEPEYVPADEDEEAVFALAESIFGPRGEGSRAEDIVTARTLASSSREVLQRMLDHLERGCRDALLIRSGCELTGKAHEGYIEEMSQISFEGMGKILEAIKAARSDIATNVNAETVLDSLFLHIGQARQI